MDKILVEFNWDCGRMGNVCGLFVTSKKELESAYGKEVCFGEILGKHSNVYGELERKDFKIKSDDQDFILKLVEVVGSYDISGYNPLNYLEENES